MAAVVFYYDIVCPFAYMASRVVDAAVKRAGGKVHWTPVLLGGLYKETEAPQGKDGSAMDVMAASKLSMTTQDLRRQLYRFGINGSNPHHHPQKTLHAMRVLAGISDHDVRVQLSKAFYEAYWQEGLDMEEHVLLQSVTDRVVPGLDVSKMAVDSKCSTKLKENTQEAAARGAFGVPSFYVSGQLLWGVDRLHFVEKLLGRKGAEPERLAFPSQEGGRADLTFFFDYSSPWSYLGNEQLERTIRSVSPIRVHTHYVPILLGALFKKIGTSVLPLQSMAPAKQRYYSWELQHYAKESNVPFSFPDFFPLRSVLPLRVTLAANNNPSLITLLYRAVWRDHKDISDPEILKKVLEDNGYPALRLLEEANSQPVKDQLFANTERAVTEGVCGVPTFKVNDGPLLWGQDRLHVVADMLCGWKDQDMLASKL